MTDVTLLHGDCLELMPTLPAQSVAMCFADLPYGVTTHQYDRQLDLFVMWQALSRITCRNAATILTGTQPFVTDLINSNRKQFRYDVIWHKSRPGGFLNASRMPLRSHEHMLFFYRTLPNYYPQFTDCGKPHNAQSKSRSDPLKTSTDGYGKHQGTAQKISTMRMATSVQRFLSVPGNGNFHPAQKPLDLLEWLINSYTRVGDIILDFCAGSGTTAIAAMRTGRRAICIEKDPTYFAAMTKRVADERARMHQAEMAL